MALALSGAAATPLLGQTALTSGAFTFFEFGAVGSGASGQPFTYTSASPFTVTVVDGFQAGDRFDLFSGATLIGRTSLVATNSANLCTTGAACLANPALSVGTFAFGAGAYSFTVVTAASPFGSGGAFIGANVAQVTSTVPEPTTLGLLAGGVLAVGGLARRRRTA
jgi:hypothetical protein